MPGGEAANLISRRLTTKTHGYTGALFSAVPFLCLTLLTLFKHLMIYYCSLPRSRRLPDRRSNLGTSLHLSLLKLDVRLLCRVLSKKNPKKTHGRSMHLFPPASPDALLTVCGEISVFGRSDQSRWFSGVAEKWFKLVKIELLVKKLSDAAQTANAPTATLKSQLCFFRMSPWPLIRGPRRSTTCFQLRRINKRNDAAMQIKSQSARNDFSIFSLSARLNIYLLWINLNTVAITEAIKTVKGSL